MPQSPESRAGQEDEVVLTGIYLDIPSKTVLLAAGSEVVASVRLAPQGLVFQAGSPETSLSPDVHMSEPEIPAEVETERPRPVTLQGKLKSTPRPGRPDRTGKPTAWARFAAHEDEQDSARMYSTTFHRHTVDIALSLAQDAPLTVQGYPHKVDDPASKRMDTLSVINLLDYPGKQAK